MPSVVALIKFRSRLQAASKPARNMFVATAREATDDEAFKAHLKLLLELDAVTDDWFNTFMITYGSHPSMWHIVKMV